MKPVVIELTRKQSAQILPLLAKVEYYGAVIGQVGHLYDSEKIHANIGVVSRAKAEKIAEILSEPKEPKSP